MCIMCMYIIVLSYRTHPSLICKFASPNVFAAYILTPEMRTPL